MEYEATVWKVVHTKGTEETVYLVSAWSQREAEREVLEMLYGDGLNWTNAYLKTKNGCGMVAAPYVATTPYKLYTINTATGEMT